MVNPQQARALLLAVAAQGKPGRTLTAFFATMYFAALRPSEIMAMRIDDYELPKSGWGWLLLAGASPYTGPSWTENGKAISSSRSNIEPWARSAASQLIRSWWRQGTWPRLAENSQLTCNGTP